MGKASFGYGVGRGGDQVAVKKKNDAYDFFGGLSKGVEKRDKVRTRVIAASISDHMKASDIVFIMGHQFSDLDAVVLLSVCGVQQQKVLKSLLIS